MPTDDQTACCHDCLCEKCVQFAVGELVELSPQGVFALGKLVNRGQVLGYTRLRERLVAVVHWSGFPPSVIGHVCPLYLQKLFCENKTFL